MSKIFLVNSAGTKEHRAMKREEGSYIPGSERPREEYVAWNQKNSQWRFVWNQSESSENSLRWFLSVSRSFSDVPISDDVDRFVSQERTRLLPNIGQMF